MSFSRPDPASPAQVADASFSTGRRGFDQHEVRDFLRMVSAELNRLQERERFLQRELQSAQAEASGAPAQLDDEALTRLLGEETARVLHAARESATEIREKAEQAAARMLLEASDEATRMREEAEIESSRRRSDAANDAEAELSMAKQQGREMVNEARAYRERVLSELARRRELAREQIEQLIHGRDRLMQAFERARMVAVDVVAEMQPLGEPDEYVNLAPSTGPVPVMVARAATSRFDAGIDRDHSDEADGSRDLDENAVDPAVETEFESATEDSVDSDAEAETIVGSTPESVVGVEVEQSDEGDVVTPVIDLDAGSVDDVVVDLFARLRASDTASVTNSVTTDVDTADIETADIETTDVETTDTDIEMAAGDVEREDTLFAQRSADLTPLITSSARKLRRVLADEQNEVLDALRRRTPVTTLDDLLPPSSDHADRYAGVIGDDLLLAAQAGAALLETSRVSRLPRAFGKQAVEHASEMIGRWLVEPLRDRLERCVSEGAGDNSAITKKVRAVYREFKTQRIDEHLDDVLLAAHGRGVSASIASGALVEWTPDPAQQPCADCDDNRLAGAIAVGTEFPTGHQCTPAHPGCRCLLVPADR